MIRYTAPLACDKYVILVTYFISIKASIMHVALSWEYCLLECFMSHYACTSSDMFLE